MNKRKSRRRRRRRRLNRKRSRRMRPGRRWRIGKEEMEREKLYSHQSKKQQQEYQ